jgi:hypothetical protein
MKTLNQIAKAPCPRLQVESGWITYTQTQVCLDSRVHYSLSQLCVITMGYMRQVTYEEKKT